jgi:uncharacterized protein DUF4397
MKRNTVPALAACIALMSVGAAPAAAAPAATSLIRGGHFSPDTPSVDVYLTAFAGGTTKLALSDVGYGDVSDYQSIPAGLYTVGMRPAGAAPTTPVAISWTLDAKPGEAFTACAIGMNNALQGRVLTDDLASPAPNQARVRIIQAASVAPKADVTANGSIVVGNAVPFGSTTDYVGVPAGSWPLVAKAAGDPAVTATANATLAAGSNSTVVLLDTPQKGISLRVLNDGVPQSPAPAGPAPTGPVEAGGGSMARVEAAQRMHVPALALTGLALTATIGLLGGALRRGLSRT